MASQERFGYEWGKYSSIKADYEQQFKNWISPLSPEDFKGKKVLDAGCGNGRNSYWPLTWGAGNVVSFDFDERTVRSAKNNLGSFANSQVFFKSIYDIGWNEEFDIVFCIGVLHHLENPQKALANLVRALKPGGKLIVWVYSYEGNEWIIHFVDPIRKYITSNLPLGFVYYISYLCSVPLWIYIHTKKNITNYLKQLKNFSFEHVHGIVFDQLIPKVANYWSKEDVRKLFAENYGITDISIISPPNKSGWTIHAMKIE